MSTLTDPVPDDRRAWRNVIVLVLAQALVGAQMPMIFTIAGLAGMALAPNLCLATLPVSLIVLGSMLTASPMSWVMQRRGRRAGFWIGTLGGAGGALISATGIANESFLLFCAGSLVTGIYMSAQGFYRFAAADTASESFRPKAISYVMAGGLVSALVGPQLTKVRPEAFGDLGGAALAAAMQQPFFVAYLIVIGLNALGAILVVLIDIPRPPVPHKDAPKGRSRLELLKTPRIAVSIIVAMVSYALMNLMMTTAPLAVVGCGFTRDIAADVVSAHVLAMFVPSFFTGHIIARFGSERVMALGLLILAGSGLVGIAGVELSNFFVALVLLGIGWNFGFIGATAMLASAHRPEERGRIQGLNDMIVFGCVTLASLSSGGLMNCSGGSPQEGWTAVNLAMIPFLTLAGGALIWLWLRPKEV